MALGLRILEIERIAQSFQGDVVGVLQVFHGLAQHLRPGPYHLFQILLVVVALLQGLAVIKRAYHRGQQVLALKGFEQVIVCPPAHGVDGHADVMDGGHHDHGQMGLLATNAVQQNDAVAVLHHDIGQYQVEGVALENLKSSRPLEANCTS